MSLIPLPQLNKASWLCLCKNRSPPETGGVFPGLEATPLAGADGPESGPFTPPGDNAVAPLPSASVNLREMNRSAAAPSAAAPSAAAPRFFPRPVPQPITQYAEIERSIVSVPKSPASVERSNLLDCEGARMQGRHGEGECVTEKSPQKPEHPTKGGQTTTEKKGDCVEALANAECHEENTGNGGGCVNRQESREPRVAPVFVEEPSWSMLGCTLGFVGTVLMLLLALIYSLTTYVPLPPTTQTSPLTSTARGSIYCSSQYCDREADYLRSLLGASGKSACENFYEYVCGGWSQAHPLYSTSGAGAAVSSDTVILDKLDNELVSLLTSSNEDDLRVAAAVYEACIDRKKADTSINDVKELFKSWTIREWPRGREFNDERQLALCRRARS
ncbi:hypothetical protein MTO96_032390 [Rhipicephalus appendiculatus]